MLKTAYFWKKCKNRPPPNPWLPPATRCYSSLLLQLCQVQLKQ